MPNLFNKSYKNHLFIVLIFILLTANFQKNIFHFADVKFFSEFQLGSEALVVGAFVADNLGLDKKGSNLGFVSKSGSFKYPDNIMDAYTLFPNGLGSDSIVFAPYRSQVGIQGTFYSKIREVFGINKLGHLRIISSCLLSLTLITLFLLYRKIFDSRFAAIFLIVLAGSPWVISFARNLYWSPFLWFLPAVFSALLYLASSRSLKALLLIGILVAVFLKSLAGYEYLSTITILAGSVFLIGPYFDKTNSDPHPDYKTAFLVFLACLAGFLLAILIHAGMRGDSIVNGLVDIFEKLVKKRTYGDPSLFPKHLRASLEVSPLTVVKTYITTWSTPITLWLPGKLFPLLMLLSLVGLYVKYMTRHKTFKRDLVLLSVTFLAPCSWFILSKGHSYIHTHMNYVLWYFGFIPALFYVGINSLVVIWAEMLAFYKRLDPEDF